jgi:hypothetical protein
MATPFILSFSHTFCCWREFFPACFQSLQTFFLVQKANSTSSCCRVPCATPSLVRTCASTVASGPGWPNEIKQQFISQLSDGSRISSGARSGGDVYVLLLSILLSPSQEIKKISLETLPTLLTEQHVLSLQGPIMATLSTVRQLRLAQSLGRPLANEDTMS